MARSVVHRCILVLSGSALCLGAIAAEIGKCSSSAEAAAKAGDTRVLAQLLEKGEKIDCAGEWQQTLLHKAILGGHSEMARYLIDRGAAVNATDDEKNTALKFAAMMGQPDVIARLLQRGATVDVLDDGGMTPLMWAANRNHLSAVDILVKSGANVNRQSLSRDTALIYTSSPEVAKYLLRAGADPRSKNQLGRDAIGSAREQIAHASKYGNVALVQRYEEIIRLLEGHSQ